MKHCFFCFLTVFTIACLLLPQQAFSQNQQNIDSLQKALSKINVERRKSYNTYKEDTLKVKILFSLSREYGSNDEAKALDYAEKLIELSEKIGYKKGTCLGLRCKGYTKTFHSDYSTGLDCFLKGLTIAEQINDKPLISVFLNYIGLVYIRKEDYAKGLEYFQKSLKIAEVYNKHILANIINNFGNAYFGMEDYDNALKYYQQATDIAKKDNDMRQYAVCLEGVGDVYCREKKYDKSLQVHLQSLELAKQVGNKHTLSNCLQITGIDYTNLGKPDVALDYEMHALNLAKEIKAIDLERDCFFELERIYSIKNNPKEAYENEVLYDVYKDSVNRTGKNEKITQMQMAFDFEKKQAKEKAEQAEKDAKATEELKQKKYIRYAMTAGLPIVFLFSFIVFKRGKKFTKEKQRSESLLLNILPAQIAEELKETGASKTRTFEMATVMFTDFKDFSRIAEKLTPEQLVDEIDYCFTRFDEIIDKYKIEKIKTIGDSYVCVGGLPEKNTTNPEDVVNAALEIRDFISHRRKEKIMKGEIPFEIRIGINTGPLAAGIVGAKKFGYDIWGDTVNIASRMEYNCAVGEVNISEFTHQFVKDKFDFVKGEKINTKSKGEVGMYFVKRK